MQKVYVVGYGLIDALGNNPKECFGNILNEKDFNKSIDCLVENNFKIQRGIPVEDLRLPETFLNFPEKMWKYMMKTQKMCMHSVDYALKKSNLPLTSNVSVILSSVANEIEPLEDHFDKIKTHKRVNPKTLINRIMDTACSHVTSYYGFMGASFSIHASCATSLISIDMAMKMINEYDYIVVGAGDAGCNKIAMNFFSLMGVLGNYSKPFDDERNGFVMGEGFGALVLQSEEMVKKYNSKVYATLYPVGVASDALDYTSPAQDGRGSRLSLEKSLKYNLEIDAINAHATSTKIGDLLEYKTLTDVLGKIPIYAPKSKIGHTLAGAGIIETVYAIESMRHGIIPHVHNLKNCSFDFENLLVREPKKIDKKVVRTLNTSFGFGGKCCSQVIEVTRE